MLMHATVGVVLRATYPPVGHSRAENERQICRTAPSAATFGRHRWKRRMMFTPQPLANFDDRVVSA